MEKRHIEDHMMTIIVTTKEIQRMTEKLKKKPYLTFLKSGIEKYTKKKENSIAILGNIEIPQDLKIKMNFFNARFQFLVNQVN